MMKILFKSGSTMMGGLKKFKLNISIFSETRKISNKDCN